MVPAASGCPALWPGNSQRVRVLAVVVPGWLPASSRSRAANGSGTGAGGSPRRMSTSLSCWMTSSVVSRIRRLTGWAYRSIRHAATLVRSGMRSSVTARRIRSRRWRWETGSPLRTCWRGMSRRGMCWLVIAQPRKPRTVRLWCSAWVACHASTSAWLQVPSVSPLPSAQVRKALAAVNCTQANRQEAWVSGRRAARARSRGSRSQVANWRRSLSRGAVPDPASRRGQPGLEVQELLVDGGQGAAGREVVTQVRDGPPVRQLGKRLVGEGDLAGGQAGEQGLDLRAGQPHEAGAGAGHRGEMGGQRRERLADGAGAVVEQHAQLV